MVWAKSERRWHALCNGWNAESAGASRHPCIERPAWKPKYDIVGPRKGTRHTSCQRKQTKTALTIRNGRENDFVGIRRNRQGYSFCRRWRFHIGPRFPGRSRSGDGSLARQDNMHHACCNDANSYPRIHVVRLQQRIPFPSLNARKPERTCICALFLLACEAWSVGNAFWRKVHYELPGRIVMSETTIDRIRAGLSSRCRSHPG